MKAFVGVRVSAGWRCAACGGVHHEPPMLEVCISSCCHVYVRLCRVNIDTNVDAALVAQAHAAICPKAKR